jgi:3-dehydroquinate synthase
MNFTFGEYNTRVVISREIPDINKLEINPHNVLIIADENTAPIADKVCSGQAMPFCILKSGEENKTWQSVQTILNAASEKGLGRDGTFIAIGGGVIGDLAGFAASVYMRGLNLILIPTTLLAMVDASVGGKTGFDLFGVKNLAGSFYPAQSVYIPLDALSTLPQKEWKSGFAELIKTAILDSEEFLNELLKISDFSLSNAETVGNCIERAVRYKGSIVCEDPKETGIRKLLNLGHTFGHALESTAGFGNLTHGEAVAWGIMRACELGTALGVTQPDRAKKISDLVVSFGYETACPHPLANDKDKLMNAMKSDKKKKSGKLTFIVPDEKSARPVTIETEEEMKMLENIIMGKNK